MKITPEQALAELAHLPHDQPLRRAIKTDLPPGVTAPSEVDAMLEQIRLEQDVSIRTKPSRIKARSR